MPNEHKNVDIDKTIMSNRVCFDKNSFPCFISYRNDEKIQPLSIMLAKMSVYTKPFDRTKYIPFLQKMIRY